MEEEKEVELGKNAKKEYVHMRRILTEIEVYVNQGIEGGNLLKTQAMSEGNNLSFNYNQGGVDVCTDIKQLLNGARMVNLSTKEKDTMEMHG